MVINLKWYGSCNAVYKGDFIMYLFLTCISTSTDKFMKANHNVLLLKISCLTLHEFSVSMEHQSQQYYSYSILLSVSSFNRYVDHWGQFIKNLHVSFTLSQTVEVQDQTGRGQFANSAALGTEDAHNSQGNERKRLRGIEPGCECTLTCSIQSYISCITQPSRQR